MKYIHTSLLALTAVAGLALTTGCQFQDDDYFSESASLRQQHNLEELKQILTAPASGWVVQYHCSSNTDKGMFEGFNLFGRFENSGKVTLASDHSHLRDGNAGKYTEATSIYEILSEESTVLAFSVWNDVLTPLSDPVDPKTLQKDGEGMGGDDRLVVTSLSKDEIIFRGERHGGITRMIPCPTATWQEYIDQVNALRNYVSSSTISAYYFTNGTDTLYLTGLRSGRVHTGTRVVDPLQPDSASCCFTPSGFRMEKEKVYFKTDTCQEFVINADSSMLVSGDIQVIPMWDTYVASHSTVWNFDETLFTTEQSSLFASINEEVKKYNANWSLKSLGIGKSTGGNAVNGLVMTFYTNAAKSKTNTAGLTLDCERLDYAKIAYTLSANARSDKNLETIQKKAAGMTDLARSFAATVAGRYNVKPNNYFQPTGATFEADGSGTSFRLQ